MNNRVGLALAVGGGYVLGRTRKARLALGVGSLVLGKRLSVSPRELGEFAAARLKDNPQLAELGTELRQNLGGMGKAATGALATRQLNGLADRLHDRTRDLRGRLGEALPGGGKDGDTEDAEDTEDAGRAGDAEEPGDSAAHEDSADSGGSGDGATGRSGQPRRARRPAVAKTPAKTPGKTARKTARKTAAKAPAGAKRAAGKEPAAKKTAGARKQPAKRSASGRPARRTGTEGGGRG